MKKAISVMLVLVLMLSLWVPVSATKGSSDVEITYRKIKVVVNGVEITPCDGNGNPTEPFIMKSTGTTYLPVRAVANALGLSAEWNPVNNTISLTSGEDPNYGVGSPAATSATKTEKITYRDISIYLNGTQVVTSAEPFIMNSNSTTYLPLRAVASALGLTVGWEPSTSTVTLTSAVQEDKPLSAEQIYAKCSSSVFYIEIYDRYGSAIASGSGVFISPDGKALTNHHVVEDAYSAKVMTTDGSTYDVTGYYDARQDIDMALIQVAGSGFPCLSIGDSTAVAGGQNVFAIGSPLGLDNTISQGIISNANRVVDGLGYIQITAPISHGSSGGALINDRGQLIGITTATFSDGQNLNLAVPVHRYKELSTDTLNYFPIGGEEEPDFSEAYLAFDSYLTVNAGSTGTVSITADPGNYYEEYYVSYDIADTSVVSAEWGEWYGMDIDLYVTGLTQGSTVITLTMYTSDTDTYITSASLFVTVEGSGGTVYYPGYYPAPDFGAFLGIDACLVEDGVYYYWYSDFSYMENALDSYEDALYANGFEFWMEDTDSYGDPLLYYHNEYHDLYLCLGIDYVSGELSIYIMPYFGYEV